MEINNHYLKAPTKIITTQLGIPQDYKQECIDEIYKIGDQQNQSTNVKAIMSSYYIWDETKLLDPLISKILNVIHTIYPTNDEKYEYVLENCWSAIYKKNHYTVPHNHRASFGSFIYYLKSNQSSSPLIFDDCNFHIQPKSDLLVVFPSHLTHSVPPQMDNEDRICVVGNFNLNKKQNL